MMLFTTLLSSLLLSGLALAQGNSTQKYASRGPASGALEGVHDPSVARNADGLYILVSSGRGVPIRTSKDRVHWEYAGQAFPEGAPMQTEEYTKATNADLWAGDLHWDEKTQRMLLYATASSFGSQTSGIFLATSHSGLPGTWTNHGLVLDSKPGPGDSLAGNSTSGYNAIDANLFVDPDDAKWYLSFGSFWTGIQLTEINPVTAKPWDNWKATNIASRVGLNVDNAIEAPFIIKENGYYWLFSAYDKCCSGLDSTYNIRVNRADNIFGPYADKDGVPALQGGGTKIFATQGPVVGPGGQSVFRDDYNQLVLFYHYYTSTSFNLGINPLAFDAEGWPVVSEY